MPQEQRRRGRPKSFHEKPTQTTIQALDRALDVLEYLAANSGMTLTEIASDLDQSAATIYRVLSTLEARSVVEMDPAEQTWHIGSMTYQLGSAFLRRSGLAERSRGHMRHLMEQTGETSNLGIERDGHVLFISQVETHETIRAFFPPGTVSPMHASGIGKALLSCYSNDRMTQFLQRHQLEQFTPTTLKSGDDLHQNLAIARTRGWAFDDEERNTGMRCVAAPILNVFGEAIAGISVSGPTHRLPLDRIDTIGVMVREAAQDISRNLGALPLDSAAD